MDPISAIFVMVVLTGAFAKGVDLATDGLLSAEIGGGVRGVSHYAVQAGKARWRLANQKAREIRMQSSQGRKVQELLDLAGMFVRVLSGEAVRFGSGVRSGWRSGREQARSDRTKRRGDTPWPATEWLREQLVRLQETRTKTPNEANEPAANDPNGSSSDPEPEPNTTTTPDPNGDPNDMAETFRLDIYPPGTSTIRGPVWPGETPGPPSQSLGFTYRRRARHELGPAVEAAQNWADDVMAPMAWQASGVLYRTTDDIEEYVVTISGEAGPSGPGTDGRDSTPNGDPNMPLESTVPNQNGDVRCGCCAQLHKPLEPGEHCPNCHIHDHPSQIPNGTIPNAPATRGPSMDINSAPAAIAAAEALRGRFEEPESLLASLSQDAVSTLEGMGDFGTGDEADTAGRFQPVLDALGSAREAVDVYVAALHEEWDEHIAAAEGRTAGAHAPFQEV